MRPALILGLALLAPSMAIGADKPIPQDTAKMEQRRREMLEWNRRTTLGAYEKVGKKDPKWDKPAREALDLAARMFSLQVDPDVSFDDIRKPARAAIDAGCDDPFVVYLYSRSPSETGDAAMRQYKAGCKAFGMSHYPAFRRAYALTISAPGDLVPGPAGEAFRKEAQGAFDGALALLPESAASDERTEFWEDRWLDTLLNIVRAYRWLGMDAPAAYEKVDAALAKVPEMNVLRLKFRGRWHYLYGWEARTEAFAPAVPAGGMQEFGKRLGTARAALDEAWRLRPGDAKTADLRHGIEKGIGGGDRQAMETWFERAMKADGDCFDVCWDKLDWLDPKWYGSLEEMLEFGKACQATKNWRAKITLLAADAHFRAAGKRPPVEQVEYMGKPDVWAVVRDVYDEYLKHYPDDHEERSKYAALCFLCRRYEEAHAQFERLGDRLTTWPKFPNYPLASLQRYRAVCAQHVAAQKAKAR